MVPTKIESHVGRPSGRQKAGSHQTKNLDALKHGLQKIESPVGRIWTPLGMQQ